MQSERRAAIGLGANLGDRLAQLRRAVDALSSRVGHVVAKSWVHETPPWGVVEQPRFLNACAVVSTTLDPLPLLRELKSIERDLGREDGLRWGPRAIDLDIILMEGVEMRTDELTIPHAMMGERPFVLIPLAEVASAMPAYLRAIAELRSGVSREDEREIVRVVEL